MSSYKVVLVTGGAKRIGAAIVSAFHQAGCVVLIHYRHSHEKAQRLADALNQIRDQSAYLFQADLDNSEEYNTLTTQILNDFGRLDVLVNNASTFYSTPIGTVTPESWDGLFNSNLKAPFFLSQAFAPSLKNTQGSIINIVDVHSIRPLKDYPVYSMAKAGLSMLTQALAKELAPHVRVNGVAPSGILWPEESNALSEEKKQTVLSKIALQRQGHPQDVAQAALFLALQAPFVTGQILNVDGGRSLFQ